MGFWSTLAKVGLGAAAIGGAAFTGGASLSALPAIGAIGSVAGGIAGNMAAGREKEQNQNLSADAIRQRAMEAEQQAQIQAAQLREKDQIDRANVDLDQRKFSLTAPTTRAGAVARGDLMANVGDLHFARTPGGGSTGGMRPSALGPNTRAAGDELSRASLLALMKGDQFDPMKPVEAQINPGFTGTPAPQAGWWEKVLGGVGQVGSIAGALAGKPGAATPPNGFNAGYNSVPAQFGMPNAAAPPTLPASGPMAQFPAPTVRRG